MVLAQQQQADGGPVIVGGPAGELTGFTLDRLSLSLDFFYQYRRNHIKSDVEGERTDTEHLARETLSLSSRSFIGHENLVDLSINASLGFEDQFRKSPVEATDGHDSQILTLFDATALILSEGPAPVTVWAFRDQTQLDREFASSIDSTTTEFGASVRTFLNVAPTTIRFFHREQEQNDFGDLVDSRRVQDTLAVQSAWTPTDRQRLTVDYALDLVDERQASGIDDSYERHDATIVHTWQLGPDQRDSLRSMLRVFDQSGDFENRTVRLNELLRLRHTDTLDSRWDLTLEDRSNGRQDQQQVRGVATLRHKLFDSLLTTLVAGGGQQRVPDVDFTRDEYFGSIDFDYTKRVPYGRLNASATGQYEHIENSTRGGRIDFLGVSRTFNDPFPIVISQRFVIASSIVIRDSAGVQVFAEGLDYTLTVLDDRIEIRRQVGGSIADGQQVLIDYALGPEPASTTDSLGASFGLRYGIQEGALRGLSLYLVYRELNQSVDADRSVVIVANDVRNLRYGAEYAIGDLTLLAEQEHQDSDLAPFDSTRLSARYEQRLGPGSWWNVRATRDEVHYNDTENDVVLNRVIAEWGRRLDRGLDARIRLTFRDEDETLSGHTRGFEQIFELNWRYRQTSVFIGISNAMLEGDHVDSDSQRLAIGFSRSF